MTICSSSSTVIQVYCLYLTNKLNGSTESIKPTMDLASANSLFLLLLYCNQACWTEKPRACFKWQIPFPYRKALIFTVDLCLWWLRPSSALSSIIAHPCKFSNLMASEFSWLVYVVPFPQIPALLAWVSFSLLCPAMSSDSFNTHTVWKSLFFPYQSIGLMSNIRIVFNLR